MIEVLGGEIKGSEGEIMLVHHGVDSPLSTPLIANGIGFVLFSNLDSGSQNR